MFHTYDKQQKARSIRPSSRRDFSLTVAAVTAILLLVALVGCTGGGANTGNTGNAGSTNGADNTASADSGASAPTSNQITSPAPPTVKDQDLVIATAGITEKASFFPVDVDGTKLEVIAVKAPDGTIRTAFNTCQVCYDSGQGYYVQIGSELECQSCGNHFAMDQVEVLEGGCNPVPIFAENKSVTDESITIPLSFLQEAKDIFAHWKS
jgi:hypothetical protein